MRFAPFVLCFTLAMVMTTRGDNCCHCPPLWTYWNGHCYRFFNQPRLTFEEAEQHCRSFVAHLVRIDYLDENDFIFQWWKGMREPSSAPRQYVRIGFFKDDDDQWKWSDGSYPGRYTAWDVGQPDNSGGRQDCAVMWRRDAFDTGRWDDENCDQDRAFICESVLPRS